MQSSIFIGNITQMDHAYVDEIGMIKGHAINLSGTVTGPVEQDEQVVVDFSKCKKQIKHVIDNEPQGIDHKLVILPESSGEFIGNEYVTPYFKVSHNRNITVVPHNLTLLEYIEQIVSDYLTKENGVEITFEARFDTEFTPFDTDEIATAPFNYVHGLRNSTSYGCQNIAHGHLSYIGIKCPETSDAISLVLQMQDDLNNRVFANRHFTNEVDDMFSVIEYESLTRGHFLMKAPTERIVLFDTDTTIENIVEYVYERYYNELKEIDATHLFVSEGLSKGAVKEIKG